MELDPDEIWEPECYVADKCPGQDCDFKFIVFGFKQDPEKTTNSGSGGTTSGIKIVDRASYLKEKCSLLRGAIKSVRSNKGISTCKLCVPTVEALMARMPVIKLICVYNTDPKPEDNKKDGVKRGGASDPLKQEEVGVELPDDCLRKVMDFLGFKDRLRLQRVNKQWLRIGQEFTELKARDFMIQTSSNLLGLDIYTPLMTDPALKKAKEAVLRQGTEEFHWYAFLRVLGQTRGKLRSLSLVGLKQDQFDVVENFINAGVCPELKHLNVEPHVCKELPWPALDKKVQMTQEDLYPEPLTQLCVKERLPSLDSLELDNVGIINGATLQHLGDEVLPQLRSLLLHSSFEVTVQKHAATEHHWLEFYMKLPSSLERFTLMVLNTSGHLEYLKYRLQCGEPLPVLHSLQIQRMPDFPVMGEDVATKTLDLLEYIATKLAPNLTSLKLVSAVSGDDVKWLSHLKNLKVLKVDTFEYKSSFKEVANILKNLTQLRVLHFICGKMLGNLEDLSGALGGLCSLQELGLQWEYVTAGFLQRLPQSAPNLKRLYFKHGHLKAGNVKHTGRVWGCLALLARVCPRLELLDLSGLKGEVYSPTRLLSAMQTERNKVRPSGVLENAVGAKQGTRIPLRMVFSREVQRSGELEEMFSKSTTIQVAVV